HCMPITLENNTVVYSAGVGSVIFHPVIEEKAVEFTCILHVLAFETIYSLFSILLVTLALLSISLKLIWPFHVHLDHCCSLHLSKATMLHFWRA
ncbi:hypothetical protein OG21DRAFT_1418738, partial [Imleria badia]